MGTADKKSGPGTARPRIREYALLTVMASLGIFACLAYLRFGTG